MASLLTTLLFITVVGATANQTLLNTGYIEHKLESQQAYDRLSSALSTEISQKSQDARLPQAEVTTQLKSVLTPDVLRTKIDTTLKQLQAYYRGDGPVPTLDISDLVQQAQQSGLQIDEDKFSNPIKLTGATKAKKISDIAKLVSIGTLVAVAVLLAGVLTIAIKRRDYRPLANIVFSLGLMLSVTGAGMLFIPNIFNRLYKFDPSSNPFGALAHDVAIATVHDFGLRLLIPGVTLLLLGILAKWALRGKHPKHPKNASAETAPTDAATLDSVPADQPKPVSIQDVPTTPAPTTEPVAGDGPTPGAPPRPPRPRKIQL